MIFYLFVGTPESQMVRLQALKHMQSQTSRQIEKMKDDINFANVNWKVLNDYLPEILLEEADEEQDTNIHPRLSMSSRQTSFYPSSLSTSMSSNQSHNRRNSDSKSISSVCQLDLDLLANDQHLLEPFIQPRSTSDLSSDCYRTNMRNEIVKRFLTAMAVDYEKQWYLGMIRRRTLRILLETVEQGKSKLSLRRHWQLLVERFHMPLWLKYLVKFDKIKCLNRITEKLLFDHLILTIELALGMFILCCCETRTNRSVEVLRDQNLDTRSTLTDVTDILATLPIPSQTILIEVTAAISLKFSFNIV